MFYRRGIVYNRGRNTPCTILWGDTMKQFAVLIVLLAGCSTTQGLKTSRGQGEVRHYRTDFSTLWDASMWAIGVNGLEIEEMNEDQGYILAKKGGGLFTYGERIGIFIDPPESDGGAFKVEVISKKKGKLNMFAKDWKESVFAVLESRLPDSASLRPNP